MYSTLKKTIVTYTYMNRSLITKQRANYLNKCNEKKSNAYQSCQKSCICTQNISSWISVIPNSKNHQTNERQPLYILNPKIYILSSVQWKLYFPKSKIIAYTFWNFDDLWKFENISNFEFDAHVYSMKSDCRIVLLLNDEYLVHQIWVKKSPSLSNSKIMIYLFPIQAVTAPQQCADNNCCCGCCPHTPQYPQK